MRIQTLKQHAIARSLNALSCIVTALLLDRVVVQTAIVKIVPIRKIMMKESRPLMLL